MIKKVHLTKRNRFGIIGLKKGMAKRVKIIGADTETKPYLLLGVGDNYKQTNKENIDKDFLKMCDDYVERDRNKEHYQYIIFFHNAFFDLQVIFMKYKEKFLQSDITLYYDREYNYSNDKSFIEVRLFMGKCIRAEINLGGKERHRKVLILDSFMFFKSSLKNLSIDFNLEHKKLEEYDEKLTLNDMILYGKKDVLVEKELGLKIYEFYREYDIPFPFSMPNAAGRIFRKCFLVDYGSYIPLPPKCFLKYCELSYHGGKNGYYLDSVIKIPDVLEIDIVSAYPYAMAQIPNFNKCDYILVNEYNNELDGVYKFSGIIRESKYKIFFTHDFKPIQKGVSKNINKKDIIEIIEYDSYFYVKNLCVTSYELRTALKYGIVDIESIQGCLVKEKLKKNGQPIYNPVKKFVEHFFELKKQTPKTDSRYNFYKVTLNSLYGKFIESNEIINYDNHEENEQGEIVETEKEYKAGALYNPMIATLITGYVRAYIFELENNYQALHTSTDSIKTIKHAEDIKNIGKELGQLEIAHQGDCLFFRNKCYIHFGDTIKTVHHGLNCNVKLNEKGERITHDSKGKKLKNSDIVTENLLKMYLNNDYTYVNERMATIKESLKRKTKLLEPCDMNLFERQFNVNIDTNNKITIEWNGEEIEE